MKFQSVNPAMALQAQAGRFKINRKRGAVLFAAGAILAIGIAVLIYTHAGEAVPNVLVLQRAYDSEAKSGNAAHDANLHVNDALCYRRQQPGLFYCIVAFTDRRDPDQRVYYDIAELSAEGGGWQLKSGLCKR